MPLRCGNLSRCKQDTWMLLQKVYLHYLETVESFIFASAEENISSTNTAGGGAADTRTAVPLGT